MSIPLSIHWVEFMQLAAKAWVERQEPRVKVLIRIRLRAGTLPAEACIRDLSSRGMLIQAARPPARGEFVELIGPFAPTVGQVIWSGERRFGIQLRERIDVAAIIERRRDLRYVAEADPTKRRRAGVGRDHAILAVWSQQVGRLVQYSAVILAGTAIAIGLASIAHHTLAAASRSIEAGLTVSPSPPRQ